MPSFDAILRVRAKAEGQRELADLDRRLRGLGPAAESGAAGVGRMSRMLETMGGVAAGIGLSNLAGRMTDFGREAIIAGDESLLVTRRIQNLGSASGETARLFDFASKAAKEFTLSQTTAEQSVADLYGRLRPMGLSLSEIETTFNGVAKASRAAGLNLFDQKEAFRQLAQAMGSGRLQGDEFRSLMERMPSLGDAIVKVFNDIARSRGIQQITKERADQIIAEVRNGERNQTEELKRGIEARKAAAKDETDKQVAEVQRRYDRIRQLEGDRNEDADNAARRAADKRLTAEEEAINDRYEAERQAYERNQEDAKDRFLKDNQDLSDEQRKIIDRRAEDEKEAYLDALQKRQDAELEAVQLKHEEEATLQQRALRNQRQQWEQELQQQQQSEEKILQDGLNKQKQQLDAELQTRIDENKKANKQIIAEVFASVKVTRGQLKQMAADGLITPEIMAKALAELDKVKIPDPTPLQVLGKAMGDLSREIGNNLNPVMIPLASGVASLVKGFTSLPGPVKAAAVGLGLFATGVLAVGGLALFAKQIWDVVKGLKALKNASTAAKGLDALGGGGKTLGKLVPTIAAEVAPSVAGELGEKVVKQLSLDIERASKKTWQFDLDLDSVTTQKAAKKVTGELAEELTKVKPPRNIFVNMLREIGKVAIALGGLTLEVGRFAGRLLVEAVPALGRLGTALAGLRIGAIIAGWAGAVGPAVGTITAALGGLLTWMSTVFVPAMVAFFSGPVGWIALGLAALVIGMVWFREPIMKFFSWAIDEVSKFWKWVFDWIYETQVKHWVDLWNNTLKKPITDLGQYVQTFIQVRWNKMIEWMRGKIDPWAKVWEDIRQRGPEAVGNAMKAKFQDVYNWFIDTWKKIPAMIQGIWDNVILGMSSAWFGLISGVVEKLNWVIGLWNNVAKATQKNPVLNIRLPVIPVLAQPVKTFAAGGYIDRPTMALMGENRRNPREYVVPEGGMDRAAAGWQAGLRGEALVRAWQSPGLSPGSSLPGGSMAIQPPEVRIQTGPAIQLPDGTQTISVAEVAAIAQQVSLASSRATVAAVMRHLQNPAVRSSRGIG